MNKICIQILTGFFIILLAAADASAHCEIPCGIYDDDMRINMITEHITTIEKSIKQIKKLSNNKSIDHNQLTRWIMNKERHADELQEIVTQYFMTQRIKPDTKNYSRKLTVLHKMLISAMKCKQTTDLSHVGMLRALLKEFQGLYFEERHQCAANP
ncbi:MAG: superoxide dismutase [Ni] [Thermodesulfobacteriota bacterium]|nr:superoxide dismutase [Ni] [Thermodesulfobacteriota bacterium]